MRREIIMFGIALMLIGTAACLVDSDGMAFIVSVGMVIVAVLLVFINFLAGCREQKRRRAERETKAKRDTLFDNWCSYRFRPDLGGHPAND